MGRYLLRRFGKKGKKMKNIFSNTETASTFAGSYGNKVAQSEQSVEQNYSISRSERREIIRRVPEEIREQIKEVLKNGSLKNTYIDVDGNLCFIKLEDVQGPSISFFSLFKNYGVGKVYDPTPKIQRRDKQHNSADRKQILLSYIGKEDLGKLLLVDKNYLEPHQYVNDGNDSYYIIDGRQRSSIIVEFLNGILKLKGDDAADFWKWFMTDSFIYSDKLTGDDETNANKIVKTISSGKIPQVVFPNLIDEIKNHIMEKFSIQTVVVKPQVWKLTNRMMEKVDETLWNMERIQDAISRKFTDINKYVKKIDNKDIIRTSGVDVVRKVWDFLEDKPTIAKEMGYTLVDVLENGFYRFDDTNEVRKLQILITRALCIYDKHLQWGSSENILQKKILKGEKLSFTTKASSIWGFWKKIIGNKIFDESYFDGHERNFKLPTEFVGSNTDIMKLKFFLTTIYLCEIMLKDNYGSNFGYFTGGNPTRKFYKLLETVSVYLSLGKMANLQPSEYNREDSPLVKYGLGNEFYSNTIFDGVEVSELLNKVMILYKHNQKVGKDSENTLKTLIKYCETKI